MRRVTLEDAPPVSETDVRVKCVFCDGEWETRSKTSGVLHTMPPCKEFEEMDVVEFMRANRLKMGLEAPEDRN